MRLLLLTCVLLASACRPATRIGEDRLEGVPDVPFSQLAENLRPALHLVGTTVADGEARLSSGSGVAVGRSLVLTAAHTADGGVSSINGTPVEARVIARGAYPNDPTDDWALLEVDPMPAGVRIVPLGPPPEPGDAVRVLGWVATPIEDDDGSVSLGIGAFDATARVVPPWGGGPGARTPHGADGQLWIDLRAWEGLSGGPVLDDEGRVVAVVTLAEWRRFRGNRTVAQLVHDDVRAIVEDADTPRHPPGAPANRDALHENADIPKRAQQNPAGPRVE